MIQQLSELFNVQFFHSRYALLEEFLSQRNFKDLDIVGSYIASQNQLKMEQRKSRVSQALSQLVHGKPNLPRCQQPCMFEILSWGAQSRCAQEVYDERQKHFEQSPAKIIEYCPPPQTEINRIKSEPKMKVVSPKKEPSPVKRVQQPEPIQQPMGQPQIEGDKLRCCSVHGKGIKAELYSCEKCKLKKSISQDFKKTKTSQAQPKKKLEIITRKLNESDQNDRRIIEERKKRIKEFKLVTRELPNSSSVTYFGKPVFQAYGRGNSVAQLKTYNVMPHRGENNPKDFQSHVGALIKGRKVKAECHIPRRPVSGLAQSKQSQTQVVEQPINLPIQEPDLINHIRFSVQEPQKKKEGVPRQASNRSTRMPKKKVQKPNQKMKKMNKTQAINYNDGLKYMNKRDNLMELLEEKKTKSSKLAFKVTECYPLPWNCNNTCQTNPFNADWERVRPAGKHYPEALHVDDLIRMQKPKE